MKKSFDIESILLNFSEVFSLSVVSDQNGSKAEKNKWRVSTNGSKI